MRLEAATPCDTATFPTAQCCVLSNLTGVDMICKILLEFWNYGTNFKRLGRKMKYVTLELSHSLL